MNVAAGRVAHTRKETVIVSVSTLGIDAQSFTNNSIL